MADTNQRTFIFGTTVVIQETKWVEHDAPITRDPCYVHRVIIGTITSEWSNFQFPAYLTLGGRTFISIIDGRSVFPTCFEVVAGMEKL